MTHLEYIVTHLIPTWFRSFWDNFRMWRDLITENYEPYVLLKDDDPFEETYNWFWTSINLDETYPKEFLESLIQMAADVESGKVKTYPMTKEMFEKLDDLVGHMLEFDLDTELTDE